MKIDYDFKKYLMLRKLYIIILSGQILSAVSTTIMQIIAKIFPLIFISIPLIIFVIPSLILIIFCLNINNFVLIKKFIPYYFLFECLAVGIIGGGIRSISNLILISVPFVAYSLEENITIPTIIAIAEYIFWVFAWLFKRLDNFFLSICLYPKETILNEISMTYIIMFFMIFISISYLTFVFYKENKQYKELIKSKTDELENYNKKLQEVLQQKTDFFVNLAHETRTPLSLILNYLNEYIKKQKPSTELNIIKSNFNKLLRDMVNFLDIQKLERGQIYYDHNQTVELVELLKNKIELFKETANMKKIKISLIIRIKKVFIKIDSFAIDRIINNLIDNAIKYNKPNGKIKVLLLSNDKDIQLIVSDTGIGISDEQKMHIFEPYHQMSHEKRQIQGLGMGLSIVKIIMHQINGNILIDSIIDKGTTFTLVFNKCNNEDIINLQENFDLSKPISIESIALKPEIYDSKKQNIFVVEDNIEYLSLLQNTLSNSFNFYYATDGQKALEKINNIPLPNIIIADIMMSNMDGYKFHDEIMKEDKFKSIPFIFLTAKTSSDDNLEGLKKGAIDFISKPVIIDVLIAKINSLLKQQEAQKNDAIIKKEKLTEELIKQYKISKKQIEIIKLMAEGLEYKAISTRLGISPHTINTHIKRLFEKCNVVNKLELLKVLKFDFDENFVP